MIPTHKTIQQMWEGRESGLIIPAGFTSDLTHSSSQTYLQIKGKAVALRQMYADSATALPATCGLATLIADAIELSDSWLTAQAETIPVERLFRAAHLDRIAESALPLRAFADRSKFLKDLTTGSLDPFDRVRSKAKDVLWDLDLWSFLNARSLRAMLEEPPDIVVEFEGARIGIACKKLYSTRHVQNIFSQAVAQIESSFDFGIVAINIDDLFPPDMIIRAPTQRAMGDDLHAFNLEFIRRHERHFRKYLGSGRLISAMVSSGGLADVYQEKQRLVTARQAAVWTIPGLPANKDRVLRDFYNGLMQ